MSRPFLLAPSAARDLDDILEYALNRGGPAYALRIHRSLWESFSKLAGEPELGHVRRDLADESLRVWVVLSYLIIYRPSTEPLQVIRVIHGARDLPAAFDEVP